MLRSPPTPYRPEFAQAVIDEMAQGYSFGGFAGRIGIARRTVNKWRESFPEFDEACSRAMSVRQRWWETLAKHVAETGGQGAQGTIVMFGLINSGQGDWKQKQEIEHTGQITLASLVEQSIRTINEREAPLLEHEPAPSSVGDATSDDHFD